MTEELPRIGAEDIKKKVLDRLDARRKENRDSQPLLAFFGTGSEEVVSVERHGELRIVPVRSEIDWVQFPLC